LYVISIAGTTEDTAIESFSKAPKPQYYTDHFSQNQQGFGLPRKERHWNGCLLLMIQANHNAVLLLRALNKVIEIGNFKPESK